LVGAEKTAVIWAVKKPEEVFIATGGLQNMRAEVINAIRDRRVVAFPDKGSAYDVWKNKISSIMPGSKVKVSNYLQDMPELKDGADVADLIIINKIKEIRK